MQVDDEALSRAIRVLRGGGLVAFPTETVYGLGADATNAGAVRKIFAAKSRPSTNPLIAHVADAQTARRFAAEWPASADILVRAFWPGPLTIVLPRAGGIVPEATAGRDTVGLRAPNHPVALRLLAAFGGPVVAPSANRSTRVSPTTADHVREELGSEVALVLDGGRCAVGIESTVLDLSRPTPVILRPGAVTRAQIERQIGAVEVFAGNVDPSLPASSPGQQAIHYAPRTPAFRFSRSRILDVVRWRENTKTVGGGIIGIGPLPDELRQMGWNRIEEAPADPVAFARELYGLLRALDSASASVILIEMPLDEPAWAAVRDRITRATRPVPDAHGAAH